jgi:ankyrin repeat protein
VPAPIATARELLKAGLSINVTHEIPGDREVFLATPLWYAFARGQNGELARFFLKAGANPDDCLWTVIWSNEPELVRLLLDSGSKTEVRFDGETPLIYTARLGREKAVLELVAAGADIAARDSKGRTAAEHARRKRLSQAVLTALGEQQTANPVLNRTRRKRRQVHGVE